VQHQIYWGKLKKPIEWSLKTWLAPWSYPPPPGFTRATKDLLRLGARVLGTATREAPEYRARFARGR
jgi:hypothetical protein